MDFAHIRSVCQASTAITKSAIDDLLVPYAAQKEQFPREIALRFGRFGNAIRQLQPGWVNLFKAQYIGHRIFRKGGLIKKYLNHTAVKDLTPKELNYLNDQASVPWRFSFSIITAAPDTDFYQMEDVFSGESFLLYSPSVTKTLAERSVTLWFNLIGFNGHCWQSFGPVTGFRSFAPDDIFFFATELNPKIETEEELMEDVEANPVPYMLLVTGSNYPATFHGEDEMIQAVGEFPLFNFDSTRFRKDFTVEFVQNVYRMKPGAWAEPPHFAAAYYSEKENTLLLTALTDSGYEALARTLIRHGLNISTDPDIRLHLPMIICIQNILGKELHLNPYEELFNTRPTPGKQAEVDRLNHLLSLALPYINAGQDPDIAALAKEAGVEEETARDLLAQMTGRISMLREKGDKGRKER
ncbi:MAG TPA: hypothetical protein VG605_12945 [Puia sp.]|nr:hypothetical protein [Puia sp.]